MYRRIPEPEIINPIRTFSQWRKRTSDPILRPGPSSHTGLPFDGAGIENPIDTKPSIREGICLFIEVITPEERRMSAVNTGYL